MLRTADLIGAVAADFGIECAASEIVSISVEDRILRIDESAVRFTGICR